MDTALIDSVREFRFQDRGVKFVKRLLLRTERFVNGLTSSGLIDTCALVLNDIESIIVLPFFVEDVCAHLPGLLIEMRAQKASLAYLESFLALLRVVEALREVKCILGHLRSDLFAQDPISLRRRLKVARLEMAIAQHREHRTFAPATVEQCLQYLNRLHYSLLTFSKNDLLSDNLLYR